MAPGRGLEDTDLWSVGSPGEKAETWESPDLGSSPSFTVYQVSDLGQVTEANCFISEMELITGLPS